MDKLTQKYVKEALNYDQDTGIFIWRIRPAEHFKNSRGKNVFNTRIAGSMAGSVDSDGYISIGLDGRDYKAHRLVFLYIDGYFPENLVDHIDRDRQNNRRNNLRESSRQCNGQNCNISKSNKSGVTGVYWNKCKNKWVARIMISRKTIYLGYYENIFDAVCARLSEEIRNPLWRCSVDSPAKKYIDDFKQMNNQV